MQGICEKLRGLMLKSMFPQYFFGTKIPILGKNDDKNV